MSYIFQANKTSNTGTTIVEMEDLCNSNQADKFFIQSTMLLRAHKEEATFSISVDGNIVDKENKGLHETVDVNEKLGKEYSQTTDDLVNVSENKMDHRGVPNENQEALVDPTFDMLMMPDGPDILSSDEANMKVTFFEHLNSAQATHATCGNLGPSDLGGLEENSHSITIAKKITCLEESNEQTGISLSTYDEEAPDAADECFERPSDDDADHSTPVQHCTSGPEVIFDSNDQNTIFSIQVSNFSNYPDGVKCKKNSYPELQVPSPTYQALISPYKVDHQATTLGPSFVITQPQSPFQNYTKCSSPLADLNRKCEVQNVVVQESLSPKGSSSPNEETVISVVRCETDIPGDHGGLNSLVPVCEKNTSLIPSGNGPTENKIIWLGGKEGTSLGIPESHSYQVRTMEKILCSRCESVACEGLNGSASKSEESGDDTTLSYFQELTCLLASEEKTTPLMTAIDNSASQSIKDEKIIAVPAESGPSDGSMPDDSDLSPCNELNSVVSVGRGHETTNVFSRSESFSSSYLLQEKSVNLSSANVINDVSCSPESFGILSKISTPADRLATFQNTTGRHCFLECFKAKNEDTSMCVAKVRQFYENIDAGHFILNNDSYTNFPYFFQKHIGGCALDICEFLSKNEVTGIHEKVESGSFPLTQSVKEGLEPLVNENTQENPDVKYTVNHGCSLFQPTHDLKASVFDHHVTPSSFSCAAKRPYLFNYSEYDQSTPPVSQSVLMDSSHKYSLRQLKSSQSDGDGEIPSKVKVIDQTDVEVYSSDQAVPDCETNNLVCHPKSEIEPFYQDTVHDCKASRLTYHPRSDTESFNENGWWKRRHDMRPYDLPQNSVFSWDRADIIIENDSNCTCTSENKIIFKVKQVYLSYCP